MDAEHLIVPALLSCLAAFAWVAIVAHRADVARSLVEACRAAAAFRERQERLAAAGKPAPYLDYAHRAEAELRAFLSRR
ncbi:MAG TPA: hypothetical protein VF950_27115 [Planctomycetota bacterium]